MATFEWREEYNINVAIIDAQHRRLAELVAGIHQAQAEDRPDGHVDGKLTDLIRFTRLHFATEEQLMIEHDYPDYEAHRQAHQHVIDGMIALLEVQSLARPRRFNPDPDINDDWVTQHLLERDVDLGRFLNSKGVY